MGVSTHVWWCASADDVLVVTDDRQVRLPNAVIAPGGLGSGGVAPGEEILVGNDLVAPGSGGWRIVRWWDPRVLPVKTSQSVVVGHLRTAARTVPVPGDDGFSAALAAGHAHVATDRAVSLIGRGVGLTPEGDDYLVGAIAGYRHVAASIGNGTASAVLDETRRGLLAAARSSTTLLSFSLLRHAFAGDVAAPVGALLRALTGRGDIYDGLAATAAIGHRSGPALAGGVLCGGAAACGIRL